MLDQLPKEIRADLASADKIYFRSFAAGLRPDPELTVSAWAERYRMVPNESSARPGRWSNEVAPYLCEVMDCLSPSHPARQVTFMKSAQVGGTECGLNWFGLIAHQAPGPMGIFLPTVDMAKAYNKTKLTPSVDATPELRDTVAEQKSRNDRGSTTLFKKFRDGFALITGANSSSGLQMFSLRFILKEELSEWPYDVEGRGDPDGLVDKRATSFGDTVKIFNNSTPGIKGSCRISVKFEAGDQRRFFVPCPECGHEQILKWNNLKFNAKPPYEAAYVCAGCGVLIAHFHKRQMLAKGRWVAQNSGSGCEPSFHINQLYSPFVTWDETVAEWFKAQGNVTKEKVFSQQVLGEPYEVRGDAPDEEKLYERRMSYRPRHVPPEAIWITGAADVQVNRIEYAIYAWKSDFSSWLIDHGVIAGDPNTEAPWLELNKIVDRKYPDPWGKLWKIDAFGVDSGYATGRVYQFVRRNAHKERVYALDGRAGEGLPPLGGAVVKDVDADGRKIGMVKLWPVGTWPMKSEIYSALRMLIKGANADGIYPPGVMNFYLSCDLEFFKQITAEHYAEDEKRDGYVVRKWKKRKGTSNEQLDMAVYARALAHHCLDSCDEAMLQELKAVRHGDDRANAPSLFSWSAAIQEQPESVVSVSEPDIAHADPVVEMQKAAIVPERAESWLGDRTENWLGGN